MRVAEVMTTEVLTVTPGTPLKDVAALLQAGRISGVPVVDRDGCVLGVVSEADIILKERRPPQRTRWQRLHRANALDAKAMARTAGEAMTSPAVTITAERRVEAAASLMLDRAVNRLPVVDNEGRLVGIVTRADLVRAFVHTDEQIEREIREEVLLRDLWLEPEDFHVAVVHGDVTIAGALANDAERALLARRIALVPGVVTVDVQMSAPVQ
jgi:CBS domain-containing protein